MNNLIEPIKLIWIIFLAGLSCAGAELIIEKPFISPGAVTVSTEIPVKINFRFSPADYSGEFTLIEVDKKGKWLKTVSKVSSSSKDEQVLGNSKFLKTNHTLRFTKTGTHHFRIIGDKVESKTETIEVFPPGIPTTVTGDLSSVVKWRGREVVGNRLHVQLRKKNDYKLAGALAESVGMQLVGYLKEIGIWQFGFAGKGSAAELEKAYIQLKSSKKVLLVEPDGIMRGNN